MSDATQTSPDTSDITNMAYWFPRIELAGLPVPRTVAVHTDVELYHLLDGVMPDGFDGFLAALEGAAGSVGYPAFLRTGYGSDKHSWGRACFVESADALPSHVGWLVEWSAMADMARFFPVDDWFVRKMLKPTVLFRCDGWEGFPVTREFRFFVRNGDVEHIQPYWPAAAIEGGARPDDPDWRGRLAQASVLTSRERKALWLIAAHACTAVGGGYWSVDFLDVDGEWFLTDMAEGDKSYDTRGEAH